MKHSPLWLSKESSFALRNSITSSMLLPFTFRTPGPFALVFDDIVVSAVVALKRHAYTGHLISACALCSAKVLCAPS
jgi:hypothetical protein